MHRLAPLHPFTLSHLKEFVMPSSFSIRIHMPVEVARRDSAWASRRSRRRCARFIDALGRVDTQPEQMLGPPLIDPVTVRTVLPELMRVRPLLTDDAIRLPRQDVQNLWAFLANGRSSSLFDRSRAEAWQHAHGLVERLLSRSSARATAAGEEG